MTDGAFELVNDDLRFTFWSWTVIPPVLPHSMLDFRFQELDFFNDFDLPELALQFYESDL